jgi:hypothetical protein
MHKRKWGMGVEAVILFLLLAAAFAAVPLATLVHIESATDRGARHVDTFADFSQSRFESASPAGNGAGRYPRLVHSAERPRRTTPARQDLRSPARGVV